MIYICNKHTDPAFNQAAEEYFAKSGISDTIFYLWQNKPAVICGKFQNIYEETNVPLAEKMNVNIVRRSTGGGTVYHDSGNVNYTFISDKADSCIDYPRFMNPVIAALEKLGVRGAKITGICDISIGGYKISGSAQAQIEDKILHHGTLLYDADLTSLSALTSGVSRNAFTSKAVKSNKVPVTNIKEHIKSKISVQEFAEHIKNCICGPGTCFADINEFDTDEIEKLARDKYSSWDWNFGASPKFTFDSSFITQAGKTHVRYSSVHGKIEEIQTSGYRDKEIQSALEGAKLYSDELVFLLKNNGISESDAENISRFLLTGRSQTCL